ncbi:MAG: MarR family transcriptional regulator [Candidatus Marinimicrobia bacterium]|nr:MarR family transcriptional regulator [Candidatus Neomarinimicrobiota bacterium]MCF7904458.1 MarR family transcriptional regulator [Candidatus Neomarinimicrobiota bacterium]
MGTHYKGSQRENLVLDTWIKLSRAKNTLDTTMRHNVEAQGLTLSQFGVLEVLLHLGPLAVKDIGGKLLMTPANLVTIIDNLVKQDLVQRMPSELDRRSTIIHLTSKGNGQIQSVFENHLNELMQCFSSLDDSQLLTLGSLAKDLGLSQTH